MTLTAYYMMEVIYNLATSGMVLTQNGRNLLAKALTGKELHFTRAFTGDGLLASRDPYTMTALISPKQELPIQSMNTSQTGTCEVVLEMTNKNITTGYFVREYGLFARDPDTQQEILYAYANKGENCSYLEGNNGVDLINYTLSLITVIDQAPNITATINNSNAYVTTTKLDARFANLYAEGVTPMGFWTYSPAADDRLRPVSTENVKKLILGTHDIGAIISRLERLEDNLGEVMLTQELQGIAPNATHYIIEDFKNVNQVDNFQCAVKSIVAGDDSLDCDPIDGMLPLSWYTITDGVYSEDVQIKSINIENGIQRVILTDTIKNTYTLEYCKMYRSSASIESNSAIAPSARKSITWTPDFIWKGQGEKSSFVAALDSSLSNSEAFTMSDDITLTSDGFITLGE